MDETLAAHAAHGAAARQYGAILVTLDRRQLERLPPAGKAAQPADLLVEVEAAPGTNSRNGEKKR